MLRPSLLLMSAMIHHSPKATWLLPGPLAGTWTLTLCVMQKTYSFSQSLLGSSPHSQPRALAAESLSQSMRIGNQRNEPSATPAPRANYRACKASKQTAACANNFRENTHRKRSTCGRNKWFFSLQVQWSRPWFPEQAHLEGTHCCPTPLCYTDLCLCQELWLYYQ